MEEKILIGLDLSLASQEVIEILMEDTSEPGIFDEIAKANENRPEILKLVMEHPDTPEEVRKSISGILNLPALASSEVAKVERKHETQEARSQGMLQKIQKLTVSEKIHLAMRGGKEIRKILVKDPNKEVMLTVLDNPKITESEIELLAQSRSIAEEALRRISKNREWVKSYAVVLALITNPKTPPGISVTFVTTLRTPDLIKLEKNKNVAEAVRSATKKILHARKPA